MSLKPKFKIWEIITKFLNSKISMKRIQTSKSNLLVLNIAITSICYGKIISNKARIIDIQHLNYCKWTVQKYSTWIISRHQLLLKTICIFITGLWLQQKLMISLRLETNTYNHRLWIKSTVLNFKNIAVPLKISN